MTALWDQLALTEYVELQACDAYIKCRDEDRLVQLLMGLRPEFDNCRSGLLHRKPLPSVEDVVNELMAEETCLKTSKGAHPASTSVLVVPLSAPVLVAPINQYKTSSVDNCNYSKQPGHWKKQCPELRKGSSWKPAQSGQGYKPPQPRTQGYRPTTQYHGGQQKHYPHPPTQAALGPSLNQSGSEVIGNSSPDFLADQFQQFLAFQQYQNSTQSHALSVPCPPPPLTGSGSKIQESDWDRA
ncbi:unnamed protein product [Cuscuta epithymum]|uniref:Uncharacterized protein n=1 Tax=Cuscuta epithymum TaxID=186058 RepID=A0AAV0E898_9ASTE|nr:unnamed protein product [Cuscuta epithymum]CAH9140533.1 unnamed protein product [Cuscuta epithymum]